MNHNFLINCVEIRRWYKKYKVQQHCVLCGTNEDIEFHHLHDKKMKVSTMVRHATNLQKLIHEINKCIPLCGACHKVVHKEAKMQTSGFMGISDKFIVAKIQDIETDFMNGKVSVEKLREELGAFYNMATNPDLKKAILMEYDGLELGSKRVVT